MATSGVSNYELNRDQVITRALRIVNEIGTGETPNATRVTECALVLNDILMEWVAYGMQLWKIDTHEMVLVSGQGRYILPNASSGMDYPPTKILHAFVRNIASSTDSPLVLLTKQEYDMFNTKFQTGTVNQFYYDPPGPQSAGYQGFLYLLQPPNATFAADYVLYLTGVFPLENFDAAGDQPDMPNFYYNALVWALADQLAMEAGVPIAVQDRISRKAEYHRNVALAYDMEEGSLFIQPDWQSQGVWS